MSNRISMGIQHPNIRNIANFSIRLLQNTIAPNVNTLISPTSLLAVLNMAQLGARGMTKMEMEMIFGGNAEQLSELLSIMYSPNLGIDEKIWNYKTVRYANAVWVCEDGRVRFDESYLSACKEKSHAEIIRGDFDLLKVAKINDWAEEKTDGAIPYIVDEVPSYQIMLLLSALAFNGQWDKVYKSSDIKQHPFIAETGEAAYGGLQRQLVRWSTAAVR